MLDFALEIAPFCYSGLVPSKSDHSAEILDLDLHEIVSLCDDSGEGSHGGRKFREEDQGTKMFWERTLGFFHPGKVANKLVYSKGRIGVVGNG